MKLYLRLDTLQYAAKETFPNLPVITTENAPDMVKRVQALIDDDDMLGWAFDAKVNQYNVSMGRTYKQAGMPLKYVEGRVINDDISDELAEFGDIEIPTIYIVEVPTDKEGQGDSWLHDMC